MSTYCEKNYPLFLLYDNQKLHGWGVAALNEDRPTTEVLMNASKRWEYPPKSLLSNFFPDDYPPCAEEQPGPFISMHVYMTSSVLINGSSTCNASAPGLYNPDVCHIFVFT